MYSRADKSVAVGLLAFACSVLAIAAWLKPAAIGYGTHMQLGLPPCNFLRVTHLPCPTCGMTTCFAWAIRLQFRKAFFANPFGVLAFFGTVSLIPLAMVLLWRRISFRRITDHAWFNRAIYASTVLLFVSWIFKLAEFHFAGY
ncbi:MAG: DUF2752 domain-containing protein [Terracidiphilus sp.]